jgi:hypothetical protein
MRSEWAGGGGIPLVLAGSDQHNIKTFYTVSEPQQARYEIPRYGAFYDLKAMFFFLKIGILFALS